MVVCGRVHLGLGCFALASPADDGEDHESGHDHDGSLLRAIDELRPSALFLDSLSNTKSMPVPDLARVLEHLSGTETLAQLVADDKS